MSLMNLCMNTNIVNRCTVHTSCVLCTYFGHMPDTFKNRYRNHTANFKTINKRVSASLTNFLWRLKEDKMKYDINWHIVKNTKLCNIISRRCRLCSEEYLSILWTNEKIINRISERQSSCLQIPTIQ